MDKSELELKLQDEKGLYVVERKFRVMHYQSAWPNYPGNPRTIKYGPDLEPDNMFFLSKPTEKVVYMSDLLNKKIIRSLREDITVRTFETMNLVKDYVLDYLDGRVKEEDFGEMAQVKPTASFRVGKGSKFCEYTFQWCNPDKTSINDPWFSIRITKRG